MRNRFQFEEIVHIAVTDAQMVDEPHTVGDVLLHAIGHRDANDAVFAKRLNAKGSNNATVISARHTQHRITAFPIHLKPIPNPLDHLTLYFFCIELFVSLFLL